jgi:hypothetical protein
MRYVVALIAVLMIAICALGVVAPERLVAVVTGWPPDTRFDVAVGTRVVLGLIFLLSASRCRLPAVIYGVGILALAAALLLVLLGEPRLDALINWWSQQPALAIRAWCALAALLGVLILYAALPQGRSERPA